MIETPHAAPAEGAAARRLAEPVVRRLAAALLGPGAAALLAVAVSPLLGFVAGALAVLACLLGRPPRVTQAENPAAPAPAPVQAVGRETAGPPLLDALPEPALLVDRTLSVLHANSAATRAFGVQLRGEAVALRFRAPDFLAVVEEAVAAGVPGRAEIAEGRAFARAWSVDVAPVGGAGEGAATFLLLFADRTAEKRVERMRTDFVANASHELRTPLAAVIGFIETLQGPAREDAAARERFLGIMREQAARMSRLIDDLLSLSQIEMKRRPAPGRSVDLAELFDEVFHAMAPLVEESGMVAEIAVDPGRYEVPGERDELFQVFVNLVENACKYASDGGRLVLALGSEGPPGRRTIRAAVRDFGPGIPAEHVPRLTERFYRVNVESSRAKRGTGLGLSIVRNILLRHSARLSIESEPGKGSEFAALFAEIAPRERESRATSTG